MTDFNNLGQAALWKSKGDNPKAPVLKGNFIAHRNIRAGEEVDLAFWENENQTKNAPALKGKCSDKFVPEASSPPNQDFPDDNPW